MYCFSLYTRAVGDGTSIIRCDISTKHGICNCYSCIPQDYSIFRYNKTKKETQWHLYIILYVIRDAKPISIFWQSILVCFADKSDLVRGLICSNNIIFAVDSGQGFVFRTFEYTCCFCAHWIWLNELALCYIANCLPTVFANVVG